VDRYIYAAIQLTLFHPLNTAVIRHMPPSGDFHGDYSRGNWSDNNELGGNWN